MYLFDPKVLSEDGEPTFSEPKAIINMNNLQSYEIKKDHRVELIESKKGIFSSQKKILLKASSNQDLLEWVEIFDKILKK